MAKHPVNLKNSNKSKHINWQLDFESYVDKLSPEDLAWLDRFANEYYRAAPRAELMTRDQLRERWRDSKANSRDVTSRGDAVGRRLGLEGHAERPERHDRSEDELIDRIDSDRARYGRTTVPDAD